MATYTPILIARFWSKVAVGPNKDCWHWNGAVGGNGYGRFRVAGRRTEQPHRVAWELANGEALGARYACHTCDNKLCVNPHHIYAGDHGSNTRDAVERGLLVGNRLDQRGAANANARLSEADVMAIREMIAGGATNRAIAKLFPVSDGMISRIRRGRSWTHVGSVNLQADRRIGGTR